MSNQIRDFCDIAILKASYGLSIGQTIYVRWIIGTTECSEDDSSRETMEKEEVVWWPGKILMTEGKEERDSKGRRVYMIQYEERDEFKSDCTKVVVESKDRMSHLEYNGISLKYCKTKDEVESIREAGEGGLEETEEEKTVTIQEIIEGDLFGFSGSDESESGSTSGGSSSSFASLFNSLPHEKKIHLAQGYREFADMFISFLKDRMNNDQNKNTVTVDDVRDFIAFLGLDTSKGNIGKNSSGS